jgi:hypothetical protein
MLSILNTLYKKHTITIKEKLSSKNVSFSSHGNFYLSKVLKPSFINGVETPHQPSLCSMICISIKEPLHQQQGTCSITKFRSIAMFLQRTKYQKHIIYKPTKQPNEEKNKRN